MRPAVIALSAMLSVTSGVARAETGTELQFTLGTRVQNDSNPDLAPTSSGASTTGGIDLSFGLTTETALSNLSLQGSAGLVSVDKAGTATGMADPRLDLTYARTTANAGFTLNAGVRDAAVDNGEVTNFDTGAGRRRTANLSAGLKLGTAGPLGFGLKVGTTDLQYRDTTDPGLLNSTTTTLGTDLRQDLSPVLHLTLGLGERRFDQDTAALRETQSLDLGLTLDRPTGALSLSVTGDNTPEGDRLGAEFEHRMDLAAGSVTYSLGATRGVSDKTYTTGALHYAQTLATGAFKIDMSRAVQPGADSDAETLLSQSSLGYSHAVTAKANLGLALNWAEQRDTATDLATANTNLTATWTQNLTADWALDLGYTHHLRDQDGVGLGQSDEVTLTLQRAFSLRF